jgi:hypothetical protein
MVFEPMLKNNKILPLKQRQDQGKGEKFALCLFQSESYRIIERHRLAFGPELSKGFLIHVRAQVSEIALIFHLVHGQESHAHGSELSFHCRHNLGCARKLSLNNGNIRESSQTGEHPSRIPKFTV